MSMPTHEPLFNIAGLVQTRPTSHLHTQRKLHNMQSIPDIGLLSTYVVGCTSIRQPCGTTTHDFEPSAGHRQRTPTPACRYLCLTALLSVVSPGNPFPLAVGGYDGDATPSHRLFSGGGLSLLPASCRRATPPTAITPDPFRQSLEPSLRHLYRRKETGVHCSVVSFPCDFPSPQLGQAGVRQRQGSAARARHGFRGPRDMQIRA